MFIRATKALSFSRPNDLCTFVGILVASPLSGTLFLNLMRAFTYRLVHQFDGYKACFGSVLSKNCTDFTLSHVLVRT